MKYLKKFETEAQYTAAKSGLILPNVSLIAENNKVEYNPSSPTPPTPSHDYVEIGGIKWATMNVGATSITDIGNYYQYGKGADTYQVTSGQSDYEGEESPLAASADTATQAWGGNWHTPTYSQINNLHADATFEWTSNYQGSGVAGMVCTDNSDSSKVLFFPANGWWEKGNLLEVGEMGCYWVSDNYNFWFVEGEDDINSESRSSGLAVRPVMDA